MWRDYFPDKTVSGITVTRRDGLLIAVKRAEGADSERLRRESELLDRLDHPGLVPFVAFVDGDVAELHMRYVGSDSWRDAPPTTGRGIVAGLAAVAATVADLHERGTAHGSLVPEHVIIAADHRPVLCSLGASVEADADSCGDDLLGLAGLAHHLAAHASDDLRRSLETLAGRVSAGDLSARALTDELNRIDTTRPRPRGTGLPRLPSRRTAIATAGLLGLVLAGWFVTRGNDRSLSAAPTVVISTPPSSLPTAPTAPDTTTSTATTAPSTDPTTTVAGSTAGDDVLVIEHEGRRFGIGRIGDVAILGDWDCDGVVTAALLQPADGLVALYTTWPGPGAELSPAATQIVADATDLEIDPSDDCDRLRVIQSTGSTLFSPEIP